MALLPGHRYLKEGEIIPMGATCDWGTGQLATIAGAIGHPVETAKFYMVPVAKVRSVRSYTPQETSLQAHESQKEKGPADCTKILQKMWDSNHTYTCDELETEMGLSHQTASARVRDLAKASKIVDSGLRRKTRTGRNAIVWKALVPC